MKAMKTLMLALSLSGCGVVQRAAGVPGRIAAAPSHTAADEEALKRCEITYKLTGVVIDFALDAGLLRGNLAARVASADRELYGALTTCRTAYRLFNSAELLRAADDLEAKSDALVQTTKEKE